MFVFVNPDRSSQKADHKYIIETCYFDFITKKPKIDQEE